MEWPLIRFVIDSDLRVDRLQVRTPAGDWKDAENDWRHRQTVPDLARGLAWLKLDRTEWPSELAKRLWEIHGRSTVYPWMKRLFADYAAFSASFQGFGGWRKLYQASRHGTQYTITRSIPAENTAFVSVSGKELTVHELERFALSSHAGGPVIVLFNHLEALRRIVENLPPGSPRFRAWLIERLMASICDHAEEIGSSEEKRPEPAGYRDAIKQLLDELSAPDAIVLALCGEKGFKPHDEGLYYGGFFDWVVRAGEPFTTRLCRIFVMPEGGFSPGTKAIIAEHKNHAGVLPLIIDTEQRLQLEQDQSHGGLADSLDHGFGFVVFLSQERVVVVLHEGREQGFAYSRLEKPLSAGKILQLFCELCERSVREEANAGPVAHLLQRIRSSIPFQAANRTGTLIPVQHRPISASDPRAAKPRRVKR